MLWNVVKCLYSPVLCPGSRQKPRPFPRTSTQWWQAAGSWTRLWRSVTGRSASSPSCSHTERTTARPATWVQITPSRGQHNPSCRWTTRSLERTRSENAKLRQHRKIPYNKCSPAINADLSRPLLFCELIFQLLPRLWYCCVCRDILQCDF